MSVQGTIPLQSAAAAPVRTTSQLEAEEWAGLGAGRAGPPLPSSESVPRAPPVPVVSPSISVALLSALSSTSVPQLQNTRPAYLGSCGLSKLTTYLLTYLPKNLLILTYLPSYLPNNLLTYLQGWARAPPKMLNSIGIPNRREISDFRKKLEFQYQ